MTNVKYSEENHRSFRIKDKIRYSLTHTLTHTKSKLRTKNVPYSVFLESFSTSIGGHFCAAENTLWWCRH